LDDAAYPELVNTARLYYKMAEWYWLGGARSKAIDAQQKAMATLKRKKNVSETDVAAFFSTAQSVSKRVESKSANLIVRTRNGFFWNDLMRVKIKMPVNTECYGH